MRFSFYSQITFLLASVFLLTLASAQDKPSCLGYSKGNYAGNVTSEAECRTACETAEGLPTPDFKTSTCEEGTSYSCECKQCGNNFAECTEYRGLCEDKVCSGGSGTITMSAMVGLVVMAVAYFY